MAKIELRTWRTRVVQSCAYEIGGIVLIAPIIAATTEHSLNEGALFVILLSLAFLVWSYVHNLVFDLAERSAGKGPASARSHRWRIFHAICLEVTSIVATLPIIMWLGGFSFWQAVTVDLALSAIYAGYAYLFHLGFDQLFPQEG